MNSSSNRKIRFAFIGCGAIAEKHLQSIQSLQQGEVVGVYDIDNSRAEEFGKKYSIPSFSNPKDLVKKADPDFFSILTPSGHHADNMLALIKYRRNFIVEKPLALRLSQIDRILRKCDQYNLQIFVVQQNRFNPPIQKLKEALNKGRFGKLVLGAIRVRWCREQAYYDEKPWRGTWALDGGVLTNQASHHIDMLIWFMGAVESVMAKSATHLVNIEAEDTAVAILKFKNGALGVIEATTATRPTNIEGSISVLGEKGSVEIGGFFMDKLKIWNFKESDEMDKDVLEKFATVPNDGSWRHARFYEHVIESYKHNSKNLINGLEGRKSVELINALYKSSESGREVFLRSVTRSKRLGIHP